jgi:hypothetical protein
MLTAICKIHGNVEKTRNARMSATPARMGAEEKDRLLREYHPITARAALRFYQSVRTKAQGADGTG